MTARVWRTDKARALFGGVAAHVPPAAPADLLGHRGDHHRRRHRHGWPVAEERSQSIADALGSLLRQHGGKIRTGVVVRTAGDIPPADIVLLDLAPGAIAMLGDEMPSGVAAPTAGTGTARRAQARPHHRGRSAVDEPRMRSRRHRPPRRRSRRSPTPSAPSRGRMPRRPFVLVGQQYLADPTRSAGNTNPIWTYAHVPHGYTGDATEAILAQIERWPPAPATGSWPEPRSTTQLAACNPNYVGGDIITGANTERQVLMRPRPRAGPVPHRHPRDVHMLGGQPARCRRPRDVRLQRRRRRAPLPADRPVARCDDSAHRNAAG